MKVGDPLQEKSDTDRSLETRDSELLHAALNQFREELAVLRLDSLATSHK